MRRRVQALLDEPWLLAAGVVYVGLRLSSFVGVAGYAGSFPDTYDYEQTARLSLWSLDFWTWYKPWGTPLLWKLLPGSTSTSAPIAQWLISVGAWLVLAAVIYVTLERRWVKRAGFVVVLAFSLVPAVAVWDGALLSESLALSLSALLVAAMLLVVRRPTWPAAAAVIVAALLLAGDRATNGYLAPFLLVPLAAVVLGRDRRLAGVIAAASLGIAGLTYATANVRQWQVPLAEIVALRVLSDPGETRYFVARGMPVSSGLSSNLMANRSPLDRFERAPALQPFLPWFNSRARGVYADYLLSHPGNLVGDPIRNVGGMVSPSSSTTDLQALPLGPYEPRGYRNALPSFLNRLLYPSSPALIFGWAVAAAVIAAGFATSRLGRRTWAVAAIVAVSTLPHAVIVWTGGGTSLGRHALVLAVLLRLALILATMQLVDAHLRSRAPRAEVGR